MFEHHAVCHRCGKKEAILLAELPPDPPLGWMALHINSPYTGGPGFDLKGLAPSRHVHTFCSWQCLAEHVAHVVGHATHQKAQSPPESDASTPAERQGQDPGPDAKSLSQIRLGHEAGRAYLLGHEAGRAYLVMHDLIDAIENLEARVKALESNLTE